MNYKILPSYIAQLYDPSEAVRFIFFFLQFGLRRAAGQAF